jgi:exonuclease SbcC
MKILRIGGRNLASLSGDFEVDFQSGQLAAAGLFAICGPTGAGKSTLLDALCLALYDATPRLLKVNTAAARLPDVGDETVSILDPRTLLRRGATEGYAEVDFEAGDGLRYRARWSVRRSRNRILQRADMSLHTLPALDPIGRTNKEVLAEIAQRVGLNFEQFTRSVLLAQNEFSAFLKTEENERGELLETLTGSTIYSSLSRRAFARHRAEQAKLELVTARLADQVPLPAEERQATESAYAAAVAVVAALEPRKAALESEIRWFDDDAKLRASIATAASAAAQADASHAAAETRRAQLDAIDKVQAARPLLAETERLANAAPVLHANRTDAQTRLAAHTEAAAQARLRSDQAQQALDAASRSLREAQPALDRAKAIDAGLAALEGPFASARARDMALQAELTLTTTRLQALEQARIENQARQTSLAVWLKEHDAIAPLARQWERWEVLFQRGSDAALALSSQQEALMRAEAALQSVQQVQLQTRACVDAALQHVAACQLARDQANVALQAFDLASMQAQRIEHDRRLRDAQSSRDAWRAWTTACETHQRTLDSVTQLQAQLTGMEAEASAAAASLPVLDATALQAERSLSFARLACADNVESLRGQLEPDHPCPVCGSADHPYAERDPALHSLLGQLGRDALAAATQRDAARTSLATLQERVSVTRSQVSVMSERANQLACEKAHAQQTWASAPGYQADIGETEFEAIHRSLQEQTEALAAQEEAMRARLAERDKAQQALDAAMAARDTASRADQQASMELAAARSAQLAGVNSAAQLQRALDDVMAELDGPLSKISNAIIENFAHGWQPAWLNDPAAVRGQIAALVDTWNARTTELGACVEGLAVVTSQVLSTQTTRERVQSDLLMVAGECTRLAAEIDALRNQRATLFDGRPVAEVEQGLQDQLHTASTRHSAELAAASQAAEQAALAAAALSNVTDALAQHALATESAQSALAAWLDAHPPLTAASLAGLLSHTPDWIREERAALAGLEQAKTGAHAVLTERRDQHLAHLKDAPADTIEVTACREALATLLAERDAALGQAAQLRRVLDQDDARRQAAQAMQSELERQQQEERRWARMNELIGSSDGKRFRNYAQQFTLDVLLGYANAHLQLLARRYRLERVSAANGPSLGLMVRDQDMGGEIRSVNSLSGGESFLVSLALALGLASLSSNRVKVESLFIDEGFGSLDSETLRVAMEALDGLQATGRRVGVISHVQEMTERMAVRILVEPAGGGSSTVRVA